MHDQPLFTTRREFMLGGLTMLSAASTLPIFLGGTARALALEGPSPRRGKSDSLPILVVVQLAGGNDGLNTIIPAEHDLYHRARPRLAIKPDQALKLEKQLYLNPGATGLKALFDDGKLAIVQGVGYPNPNRSHFTSMDIWHTADPQTRESTGWIGRYFDAACKGDDPVPEPASAIALMQDSPLALQGEKFSGLSFDNPDTLTWRAAKRDRAAATVFDRMNNADGDLPQDDAPLAAYLQRAALQAHIGADEIHKAIQRGSATARGSRFGGGELARSLKLVAAMIAAEMPTQIYYVQLGGFDTHTNQRQQQDRLLRELGDAVKAFLDELRAQKLSERVLVMSFSEFGRRVQENASGGTDHGEAAPMFLIGDAVRPGLHGDHPDLAKLHRGDLAFNIDFRRVYATVLRDWLNVRPQQIVGGANPLRLLNRR